METKNTRNTTFCLFFLFFFSTQAIAGEFSCADALASLKKAHKSGNYRVSLFKKEVGGKQKLVALLGEDHIKSKDASDLGKEVLKHFKVVGVEQPDFKKMLGGKIFVSAGVVLYLLTFIFRFRGEAEGSTMEDLKEDHSEINLEQGHEPDFREHIASVYIPILFTTCLATACTMAAPEYLPAPVVNSIRALFVFLIAQLSVGVLADQNNALKTKSWGWALQPLLGLGWARNHTMVKNIDQTIQKDEVDAMLAVVGSEHLLGMADLLVNKYGYERIQRESDLVYDE